MYPLKHSFFNNTPNNTPDLTQPINHLKVGVLGGPPDEWDPSVSDDNNIISKYYRSNSLESVIWQPENSIELKPYLATSWDFEYWPKENNAAGFNNTGGIKSIIFTLREDVKFHDGSDWNATVLKWNIDRINLIAGNYSGKCQKTADNNAEGNLMHTIVIEDYKDYFTESWNMSKYDQPNLGLTPPASPLKEIDYAWYNLGPNASLVKYGGVDNILPNNTIRNPAPYGGWDFVAGTAIHYAPYDRYPIVNYVEILENPQSGGKIKVHFNHWTTNGLAGGIDYPMISYHSYRHNYTTRGIYGYENGIDDPRNAGPVFHMIGTGPYIYVEHDETGSPSGGYMIKNENYWNKTGLEANSWFDAEFIDIFTFPSGQLGEDAFNTAILTKMIDYGVEELDFTLDYNAVIANPYIDYIENGVYDYVSQVTLNCINETWWAWPAYDAWRQTYYSGAGDKPAGGVPRAMRKAMSYAFNYDLYTDVVRNGRVVRAGMLGVDSIYYNSSTPLANYNVTKAREILLTIETDTSGEIYNAMNAAQGYIPDNDLYNFSKLCASRGLNASSSDLEWQTVADTNPIFTFNFYWDSAHEDVKNVLQASLRDIGCTLKDKTGATNRVTTIIWDTVRIGHLTTFDGTYGVFSCGGWVMDYTIPATNPEKFVNWNYMDPNSGRWRTQGAGGISNFHPLANWAFCYDAEVDYWLPRMWFSNGTDKVKILNRIAEIVQTEHCPNIFISQTKKYVSLWKHWEMNFNRGPLFFANFQFHPPPGSLALSSDAGIPDIDGKFNLIWNTSIGADNYSIYRYDSLITEINGSLTLIANQNATSPYQITGLSNGTYYFVCIAHNEFGETLSNNINISVQIPPIPPQPFTLNTDADIPDDDGQFNLTWTATEGADNYSIYRYDSLITEINGSLTLIANQNATSPFQITGLSNGTYYFVCIAHNEFGETLSNNINISVQIPPIPPQPFTLNTDADIPDDDGQFNLTWTASEEADNYSIYRYDSLITEINGSLTLITNQNATSPHLINGLSNGEYYFVVVAHNQYGDTLSNNVHVVANISKESVISGYNTIVIFCIAICTGVILFKKRNTKFKNK